MNKIIQGDALQELKKMEDNSVDSVVTDPPYGWSFMGKSWDYDIPTVELWQEVLRVLKPGGHALVACGTRTQHRMAVNLEDAGFEIRDLVMWHYASGFPKSLNVGKSVDKLQGNEREDLGKSPNARPNMDGKNTNTYSTRQHSNSTKGNSPWEGWGTALKPATEIFTLCRKPLSEKNIAENVLVWGTGGLNIDGCRIATNEKSVDLGTTRPQSDEYVFKSFDEKTRKSGSGASSSLGRFPANLTLSYPENEYILKDNLTKEQKEKALKWIYENA